MRSGNSSTEDATFLTRLRLSNNPFSDINYATWAEKLDWNLLLFCYSFRSQLSFRSVCSDYSRSEFWSRKRCNKMLHFSLKTSKSNHETQNPWIVRWDFINSFLMNCSFRSLIRQKNSSNVLISYSEDDGVVVTKLWDIFCHVQESVGPHTFLPSYKPIEERLSW